MSGKLTNKFEKNLKNVNGQTLHIDCYKGVSHYSAYLCPLDDLKKCLDAFEQKSPESKMTKKEFLNYCYKKLYCVAGGKTAKEARNKVLQAFKSREKLEVIGVLEPYFETGTEGTIWAVQEDGKKGYDGLHILHPLDELTIYKNNKVIFKGKIFPDYKIGWQKYPLNPGDGQPCALNHWIHWTQIGWSPDKWASLFLRKEGEELKAKLTGFRQKFETAK